MIGNSVLHDQSQKGTNGIKSSAHLLMKRSIGYPPLRPATLYVRQKVEKSFVWILLVISVLRSVIQARNGSCGNAGLSSTSGQCISLWRSYCQVLKCQFLQFFFLLLSLTNVSHSRMNDERVMEFILMRLSFPEDERTTRTNGCGTGDALESSLKACDLAASPVFSEITTFKTTGVVMNVFLLDPPGRLLASFIWVSWHNTIGLHVLLDWDTQEYVYIDTGIECVSGVQHVFRPISNVVLSSYRPQIGPVSSTRTKLSFTRRKLMPLISISILCRSSSNIKGNFPSGFPLAYLLASLQRTRTRSNSCILPYLVFRFLF